MRYPASMCAVALATALLATPAVAQVVDFSKYPDFKGRWDRTGPPKPVACELRLWGTEPILLVAGADGLAVRAPGESPVDARVTADPAAMWLVMCHRTSALRAVLTRSIVVSGTRPWRLRRLAQLLRTP